MKQRLYSFFIVFFTLFILSGNAFSVEEENQPNTLPEQPVTHTEFSRELPEAVRYKEPKQKPVVNKVIKKKQSPKPIKKIIAPKQKTLAKPANNYYYYTQPQKKQLAKPIASIKPQQNTSFKPFLQKSNLKKSNNLKTNIFNVKNLDRGLPFKVNLELVNYNVEFASESSIYFNFTVAPNHYLYKDKISIETSNQEIKIVEIIFPKSEKKFDKYFNKTMEIYPSSFKIEVPFKLTNKANIGDIEINFDVKFQGCSQKTCFLLTKRTLSTNINVVHISPDNLSMIKILNSESKIDFQVLINKHLFWVFLLVFLGGILTSLTPCIFPMIPITVSVIGAKDSDSKLQSFLFSIIYVLGIAITYSILGMIAGMTGSLLGSILQTHLVMYIIALIFILMGLSMLDVFYFQSPVGMQSKLSRMYKKQRKGTYLGIFAMGLISGLIASPCVAPVIAFILTYVSQTKNTLIGSSLLFTFAIGMGIFLVILGTFSNIIVNLDSFNKWTPIIKKFLGLSMIFIALYYIRLILPFNLFNILSGLLILFIGFYIIFFTSSRKFFKIPKPFWGSIVILLGIIFIAYPFLPKNLFETNLNLLVKKEIVQTINKPNWVYFEKDGLELANQQNKFIMIDFYAEWCPSCMELDKNTYSNKNVIESLKDFVSIKIDGTKETEEFKNLTKKYGVIGLPTVIFINKKGEIQEDYTITGFKNSKEFLKILEKVKEENK